MNTEMQYKNIPFQKDQYILSLTQTLKNAFWQ